MIVADASAIFKLVVEEAHSSEARDVFLKETSAAEPVVEPDIALAEVFNVLWNIYTLKREIEKGEFLIARENLIKIWNKLQIIRTVELVEVASEIANSRGLTIYDSMYISASLHSGAELLTFDQKMGLEAKKMGIRLVKFPQR